MAGYSPVIGNRIHLNLFANIRPVKLYPGIQHRIHGERRSIWQAEKVDMVFVRENTEGLYAGIGGFLRPGGEEKIAIDNRVITRAVVDFPLPLSPTRPKASPLRIEKLIPSTALRTSAALRLNEKKEFMAKYGVRSVIPTP